MRWGRDGANYPQESQGFATLARVLVSLFLSRARPNLFTRAARRRSISRPYSRPSLCRAPPGVKKSCSRSFRRNLPGVGAVREGNKKSHPSRSYGVCRLPGEADARVLPPSSASLQPPWYNRSTLLSGFAAQASYRHGEMWRSNWQTERTRIEPVYQRRAEFDSRRFLDINGYTLSSNRCDCSLTPDRPLATPMPEQTEKSLFVNSSEDSSL